MPFVLRGLSVNKVVQSNTSLHRRTCSEVERNGRPKNHSRCQRRERDVVCVICAHVCVMLLGKGENKVLHLKYKACGDWAWG